MIAQEELVFVKYELAQARKELEALKGKVNIPNRQMHKVSRTVNKIMKGFKDRTCLLSDKTLMDDRTEAIRKMTEELAILFGERGSVIVNWIENRVPYFVFGAMCHIRYNDEYVITLPKET